MPINLTTPMPIAGGVASDEDIALADSLDSIKVPTDQDLLTGLEAADKKQQAYTKLADFYSRKPAFDITETAAAQAIPPEDRELFSEIMTQKYAENQPMKRLGYPQRVSTAFARGVLDFVEPIGKAVGIIPSNLSPEQERYKGQLIQARESVDPSVREDSPKVLGVPVGKWVQQAARQTYPMAQSLSAGRVLKGGAAALGATGKLLRAAEAVGTSGSFIPQIADQTYTRMIREGIDPKNARYITAISAPIEAAWESLLPDPIRFIKIRSVVGSMKQTIARVVGEATRRYGLELSEEVLQGITNEAALEVGRRLEEEVPDQELLGILKEGLQQGLEAAGPLLIMMGPGTAAGAAQEVSGAARENRAIEEVFSELVASPDGRTAIRQLASLPAPSRGDFAKIGLDPGLYRMDSEKRLAVAGWLDARLNQLEVGEQKHAEQVPQAGPPDAGGGARMEAGPISGAEPEGGAGVRGGGPAEVQAAGPEARPEGQVGPDDIDRMLREAREAEPEQPIEKPAPPPAEQPAEVQAAGPEARPEGEIGSSGQAAARAAQAEVAEPPLTKAEVEGEIEEIDRSIEELKRLETEQQERIAASRRVIEGAAPQVTPQVIPQVPPEVPSVPQDAPRVLVGTEAPKIGSPEVEAALERLAARIAASSPAEAATRRSVWPSQEIEYARKGVPEVVAKLLRDYPSPAAPPVRREALKHPVVTEPAQPEPAAPPEGENVGAGIRQLGPEVGKELGNEPVVTPEPARPAVAEIPSGQQAIPESAPLQQPGAPAPAPAVEPEEERVPEAARRPGVPKQYVKPDGMVELIHFIESEEPEIELSPTEGWKRQNSYSIRERRSAITPRTFHYLNETDREPEVRGKKYTSLVDPTSIYNLKEDPLGLKGRGRIPDFGTKIDAILEDVQREGYSGVYYQAGRLELVSMLKPVRVRRADLVDRPAEIPIGQQAILEPMPSQQPVAPVPTPAVEPEKGRVSEEAGPPAPAEAPAEPARKARPKWEPSQEEYERTRPERAKRLQASILRMRGRNPTAEQVDEWLKFAEAKQLAIQDLKREKIGTGEPKVDVERATKVEEIKKRVEAGQTIEGEAPPASETVDRELLAALREPGRREFIAAPPAPEGAPKTIGQPSRTGGIRGLKRGKAGAVPPEGEVALDIGEVARAAAERVGPSGESNEKKFFKIWRDMIRSVRKQVGAIFHPKPVLKRHVLKTLKAEGKIPSPGPATDQAINQDGLDHNTEEGVLDVIQFLIDNPKYIKYYKEDQVRLFRALEQFFPVLELEGSDAQRQKAQDHRDMVSFLMAIASAQSNLKDNTSETIDVFRGFLEYGSIPVVFEEIDLGDGVVHREPVYRLPGTVEQALKAIHQMDQDGVAMPEMVEREGRMVRVDSLTRDDQVKIRDKIGKRKSSQTKRPYSTTMGTSSGNMALERLEEWRNSGATNTERDKVFSERNRTPFIISGGTSIYNKAFNYNTVNNLLKHFGGDIGKIIQWIKEDVSIKQLQQDKAQHARRGDEPKEAGQIGSKDDILDTVWVATGQMDLIPRAFMFGPKVGAYILNHLGDSRYTTQDVWESRFWRSLNNIGDTDLGIASGLPRRIYMRESARFTDKIKEMVRSGKLGVIDPKIVKLIEDIEDADGQAGRWYFIIKAARDAGYLGAAAEKGTIADYAEEALDEHILTVELQGGKSLEEMSIWEKGIKQPRGKKKKKKKFATGQMALLGEQEVVARDVEEAGEVAPEAEQKILDGEVVAGELYSRGVRDIGLEDIQFKEPAAITRIQMPELIELAEALMGERPQLKNLGDKLRGYFAAKGKLMQIVVNRALSLKSVNATASTLQHEIGHLIDYLDDLTLARGNLLGRLRSLQYYRKGEEGFNEEITDELVGLTRWWRGDWNKDDNNYRTNPRELYADAVSVLLNSPDQLKWRAPQFYAEWLEHINNKPEVARAYMELQSLLQGDELKLAQRRVDRANKMFGRAEERLNFIRNQIEAAKRSVWTSIQDFIAGGILHRQGRILRRMKATKMGISTYTQKQAEYALDELAHKDNRNRKMLREIQAKVMRPLVEAEIEKNVLGNYMFLKRIAAGGREGQSDIGGQYELANPLGYTEATAIEQLGKMRKLMGDKKFEKLERIARKFHDIIWESVEEAGAAGVYGAAKVEELRKNKDNYVTFAVTKYLRENLSPMLARQVGTWEDIANPFDGTVLKMFSLNRLNQINSSKIRLRDAWLENPELAREFVEVPIPYGQKEVSVPAPPGMEYLYLLDDGKLRAYAVPREVAMGYDKMDLREINAIVKFYQSAIYPIFHKLYIGISTGFIVANVVRDLRRTVRLLGTAGDETSRRAIAKEYFKAVFDATEEELEQMRDDYALSTPFARWVADVNDRDEFKRQLVKYGLIEGKEEANWLDRGIGKVPILRNINEALTSLSERVENASKVAAWRVLEGKGLNKQERAFRIRNYTGTPDWRQGGDLTPFTNAFFMFSRVRWTGMGREAGLYKKAGAGRFFWRLFTDSLIPKAVMMYVAPQILSQVFGMFDWDDEEKKEHALKITQYYLNNYDVLPIGIEEDAKGERWARFFSIPMDDTSRLFTSMFFHMIAIGKESAGADTKYGTAGRAAASMMTDLYGEIVPSQTPLLDIAHRWSQYAMGINPIDPHFGNEIVPPTEWDAGGWHSAKPMLKWTTGKFGPVGQMATWLTGPLMDEDRTLEIGWDQVRTATGLSRLYRKVNAGEKREKMLEAELERMEEARKKLDLPEAVRKLNREHYYLHHNKNRTDQEEARRRLLNRYNTIYFEPLTSALDEARQKGLDDKVKSIKEDMKRAAGAMLDQKDAALLPFSELSETARPVVGSYLTQLARDFQRSPPVPQKGETKRHLKDRYLEYLDEMVATIGVVQEVRRARGAGEGELPARREALRGARERLKRVEVE